MKTLKRVAYLMLAVMLPQIAFTQNYKTLDIEKEGVEIFQIAFSDNQTTVNSPQNLNLDLFRTDTQYIKQIISNPPFKLWVILDLKFIATDTNFTLVSNALEKSTLFTQTNDGEWKNTSGGFNSKWNKDAFVFPLRLEKKINQQIFLLIENKTTELSRLHIGILPTQHFLAKQAEYTERLLPLLIWNVFLLSTILLITFYALFQFLLNKNAAYLVYSIFSFCLLIGFLQIFFEMLWSNYLYHYVDSHGHYEWGFVFMFSHLIQTYFFFVFFDLRPTNFKYYAFFKYFVIYQAIGIIAFGLGIVLQLPDTTLLLIRNIYSPFLNLGGAIALFFLYRERKGAVTKIIIAGTMGMIIISALAAVFINMEDDNNLFGRVFYAIDNFIELIFFWISLAIRDRETERSMQKFKTDALSNEIKALRSQMNPHFIFNCLNSLNLYILENHIDAASDYLQRFSKLIRLILENSRLERIPLRNELEALQLYMNLESMRFKEKLAFSIEVDPNVEQDLVSVPPLLLQPFIENSIWHGLMHKLEGGSILLKISQFEDKILCAEIIDDGIGRAAASEIKSKSATRKKSFGMKVTQERISAINQIYKTNTKVEVFDLVDAKDKANGTRVVVKIPI